MRFYVRFVGSSSGQWIDAPTMSAAKAEFARREGVIVSGYIVASRRGPAV